MVGVVVPKLRWGRRAVSPLDGIAQVLAALTARYLHTELGQRVLTLEAARLREGGRPA